MCKDLNEEFLELKKKFEIHKKLNTQILHPVTCDMEPITLETSYMCPQSTLIQPYSESSSIKTLHFVNFVRINDPIVIAVA